MPEMALRRGRAPAARSSWRARAPSRRMPPRSASSSARRSGPRAAARRLVRRRAPPSSTSARTCSSWAGEPASRSTACSSDDNRLRTVGGAGERTQPGAAGTRKVDAFGERKMFFGEFAGSTGLALGDERLAEQDAPGGEAWVADGELVPAVGGREQISARVGGAVLNEPQAGAALEQQRRGQGAGWWISETSRAGEDRVGVF